MKAHILTFSPGAKALSSHQPLAIRKTKKGWYCSCGTFFENLIDQYEHQSTEVLKAKGAK